MDFFDRIENQQKTDYYTFDSYLNEIEINGFVNDDIVSLYFVDNDFQFELQIVLIFDYICNNLTINQRNVLKTI